MRLSSIFEQYLQREKDRATVDSSAGRVAVGLLFFCFYGLIFGAFTALAGAFLLRRLAEAGWWLAIPAVL